MARGIIFILFLSVVATVYSRSTGPYAVVYQLNDDAEEYHGPGLTAEEERQLALQTNQLYQSVHEMPGQRDIPFQGAYDFDVVSASGSPLVDQDHFLENPFAYIIGLFYNLYDWITEIVLY